MKISVDVLTSLVHKSEAPRTSFDLKIAKILVSFHPDALKVGLVKIAYHQLSLQIALIVKSVLEIPGIWLPIEREVEGGRGLKHSSSFELPRPPRIPAIEPCVKKGCATQFLAELPTSSSSSKSLSQTPNLPHHQPNHLPLSHPTHNGKQPHRPSPHLLLCSSHRPQRPRLLPLLHNRHPRHRQVKLRRRLQGRTAKRGRLYEYRAGKMCGICRGEVTKEVWRRVC